MAKHLAQHNPALAGLPIRDGLTKARVNELADESVGHVLEEGNVFEVAEALAAMEEFVKCVRRDERYIQFLRDELVKYQGKLVTRSGAQIELCEAGVRYDYSHDAEWRAIDEEVRRLQDMKKMVEKKLKMAAPGKIAVDPETGEVIEGANKTSKSTYKITLAR